MQFNLKQQQLDFIGAPEQFCAYVGGIGTGKSSALILKALAHAKESPGNLGIIVRKNFTDLRDSTIADYERYTGRHINQGDKEDTFKNGSKIIFRHGSELEVLKNINAGFCAIEQADEFPDATVWEFLKMRIRRECKHRTCFLVANTYGHNWVWQIFKQNGVMPNHMLVEAQTSDYADILPPDYLKNLESLPKKLYNRYVLNSWDEAEGLVYDEYLESKHVIEPFSIPETWEKGFCLDHGFRNPTAVLWYAIDHDGIIYFYDEHYKAGVTISEHSEAIKQRGMTYGIADPSIFNKTMSRGNLIYSIADEYGDCGITLVPAVKEVEQGRIARVNEFFKAVRIKIFRNCQNTITEVGNWKWKEIKPGLNAKEEPQDLANHACDVISYTIASRFSTPDKPKDKPARYSLDHFDAQAAYEKEIRERQKGDKTW